MKKIAIIGASCWQLPLIRKAKEKGLQTHVFAWACDDVGEKEADFFYPISIIEKDDILNKCKEIGIDGICSIGSDLAAITVNYVAEKMNLVGNPTENVKACTNKHIMRKRFEANGDPSPKSIMVSSIDDIKNITFDYPLIVKPVDRSGSRGITKLDGLKGLESAINSAIEYSFAKNALVEEYATGQEYSVEYCSWNGSHHFLALTKKFTTGAPGFIETGHLEPANVDNDTLEKIKSVVSHALDSLGVIYGASHSELKVADDGSIKIIEIGGRMGGDNIGASLVELSTGFDFVGAVIDISLGIEPEFYQPKNSCAAIRFVFSEDDLICLNKIKKEHPEILIEENVEPLSNRDVVDSSSRFGYFTIVSDNPDIIESYLPN